MTLTSRTRQALAIVQIDHTLVDIMVVDEVLRQFTGRPWITVAFDIATRVVLGFVLRLDPPSATSVGLALAMACLPKDRWLKERHLDIDWAPAGLPKLIHVDNGKEFHSLALRRGCERYGMSLEYRPPGRPQFGAHIERYLGTLMRRIHGLPGTTFSNPVDRGKYRSEARATMTMAELRWSSAPPTLNQSRQTVRHIYGKKNPLPPRPKGSKAHTCQPEKRHRIDMTAGRELF